MNPNIITLRAAEITQFLLGTLKANLVPYIHGSPGIGKSDNIKAVAASMDLKLIDMRLSQCDPTDLNGFPVMENGRSAYAPNRSFPISTDELPLKEDGTPYKGWLIFFDELSSAAPSVQAAAYKILLDRQIGEYDLHPAVKMAAAGNLETDNAVVEAMSTALQSRLVHGVMTVNNEDWFKWAAKAGIDPRIIAFLNFKPGLMYNFKPDHDDMTFACPRTWHFASNLLKQAEFDTTTNKALARAVICGTVGQGAGQEFMSFCEVFGKIPTIQEIMANPEGIEVPKENSYRFAIAGSIAAHMSSANSKPLFKFLSRMSPEYQVVALRSAIMRDFSIASMPEIGKWAADNAKYMQ